MKKEKPLSFFEVFGSAPGGSSASSAKPKVEPTTKSKTEQPIIAAAQVNVQVNADDMGIPTQSQCALWESLSIAQTMNGQPICNADNVLRVIEGLPAWRDAIWHDDFHLRIFTTMRGGSAKEWADSDTIRTMMLLQRGLGMRRIGKDAVHDAVTDYALRHTRNELLDWLNSLIWDGVERLEAFLPDCMGTPDDAYARAAGRNFWVQMVARAYQPGCPAHHVLYLIGAQGVGKSSALATIGGQWYAEAASSVMDRDFYLALRGKLLIEIAELAAFKRVEQEMIKAIITRKVDTFRAPYGRDAQDYPRRCVFAATTNDDSPFNDPTGARRFWPVQVGAIDLNAIRSMREQYFAEGVARFKRGESWHEMPARCTPEVQEQFRREDAWEHDIRDWLQKAFREQVTVREIATECLTIGTDKLSQLDQARILAALRVLGWKKKHTRTGNVWVPKDCE